MNRSNLCPACNIQITCKACGVPIERFPTGTVRIEILGGIPYVMNKPEGIEVEIIDHGIKNDKEPPF